MIRTIVSLAEKDKKWLDHFSQRHHLSLAETIRLAIRLYRESQEKEGFKRTLDETAGLWKSKKKDALSEVERLRTEWER